MARQGREKKNGSVMSCHAMPFHSDVESKLAINAKVSKYLVLKWPVVGHFMRIERPFFWNQAIGHLKVGSVSADMHSCLREPSAARGDFTLGKNFF